MKVKTMSGSTYIISEENGKIFLDKKVSEIQEESINGSVRYELKCTPTPVLGEKMKCVLFKKSILNGNYILTSPVVEIFIP